MAPTGNTSIPSLGVLCSIAASLGVASHLMYFIKGEHHQESVRYIQLLFIVPIVITYGFFSLTHQVGWALGASTALTASWLAGLYLSMLVYRVFFHRLHKFPGPFMYKTSKLYHVSQLGDLKNYRRLDDLHKKYGDYVRVGPNEVSIVDPDAVDAVLGPRSKCFKAPWYDLSLPLVSLHNARDKQVHSKRRRVWDKGFNAESLRNYESRVVGYANTLIDQLKVKGGEGLNMSKWFMYYSFDVMGELAFGKSFDMLSSGKAHFAMELLHEGTTPIGIFTPTPWLFIILSKIPFLSAGFMRFINYCNDQVENRKKNKPQEPDIMSYLLDTDQSMGDEEMNKLWLTGDSRLVIVAGSDTTAATMTHVFYHLCEDPSQVQKLREELDPLVENQQISTFNVGVVEKCEHLNGVINEGLRLHPPVPSGLLRVTPADGLKVGDHFVPGDVTIGIPMFTVNRSEKVFEKPNEFIPERWYAKDKEGMVKNARAFAPFSLGPYSCIGKGLALMELRTIISLLVTQFDVEFAQGEDGRALVNDSQDMFTIALADLNLKFTPRKK